ncbi:MAG: SusF/SusE family outer membrane protein [Saprospiraceae bacterium]
MKNIVSLISLFVFSVFLFTACEEDNNLMFVATSSEEGVNFTNTLAANYLLSNDTKDNLAERFVWNMVNFGAPTNVNYDLQASLSSTFDAFDLIGSTTETNLSITVGQLMDYATNLGLDDDPTTTNTDGSSNNTGTVYFRLRAYAGAGTGNNTEIISDVISLNIEIIEQVITGACDGVFALGDALVDAQWDWSTAINMACESDILTTKFNLTNGTFRFFEIEFDWASGLNYPYFIDEGYTIDTNFEDAEDADNNFRFIGTPGFHEMVIDRNTKTISLVESGPLWILGDATPDSWDWGAATVATENPANVWSTTLDFNAGTFRFFNVQDDWGSGLNYPHFINEGFTIDTNFEDAEDGDNNFRFIGTPGTYTIIINTIDKTIVLN